MSGKRAKSASREPSKRSRVTSPNPALSKPQVLKLTRHGYTESGYPPISSESDMAAIEQATPKRLEGEIPFLDGVYSERVRLALSLALQELVVTQPSNPLKFLAQRLREYATTHPLESENADADIMAE